METFRLPGRTPVMLLDVPGTAPETVLLYGHCDKQPEMVGWGDGLGPWNAVRRGDRLYGRGAQDDGYAVFCALTAIEAVQRAGAPHARCLVLIEASEESGSPDLPAYMDSLADRIGEPDLVICLDSGCGNYEQLWGTTSLRGIINGVLTVEVLTEGVHSGAASGIVPSSFRIVRQLLSRIEDERTGAVVRDFHVEIPPARVTEARAVADLLGRDSAGRFPLVEGMRYAQDDPLALLLAGTWEPALAVIGAAGLPAVADGGNVLRPQTSLKLSLRIPPTLDAERAGRRLKEILETDPAVRRHRAVHRGGVVGLGRACHRALAARRGPRRLRASLRPGRRCSPGWAGPFPSWRCSASASRARSSSSRGRAGRARMLMDPTSSCTYRSPSASPPAWRT